jgi:glycosyltransferase involved in cell wall biosynthesis
VTNKKIQAGKREKISVIIPAYNEAGHMGGVLQVLNQVPELAQIIVVDDGSSDETVVKVKAWMELDARMELLQLPCNQGKGRALMAGVRMARHDLMLFLDADLMCLKPYHIQMLTRPIRRRDCCMALGLFENGRWETDLTHRIFPFLSGQRCLRWSFFRGMFQGKSARWSIETAFNLHAWYHYYPVQHISWPGVTHAIRTEKQSEILGLLSHLKMWGEISYYTACFFLNRGLRSKVGRPSGQKKTVAAPATDI